MSHITSILNLQGRARRNALLASRALRLRRSQVLEAEVVAAAKAAEAADRAAARA